MGFWDDMWSGAEKIADKVGDFFTGDEDQPKPKPVAYTRPEFDGQFDWSRLNAAYAPQEHPYQKRTWLTGGDPNSLTNSWNTPFLQRTREYFDKAIKDGTAGTWFKKKDATGVMLWDYDDDETGKSYRFGDVFEDGKYLGNVYEHGGNEVDADLLMSQLTLSVEQQNHVAGQRDPQAALKDELARFRETWTKNARDAESLREHTDKVAETQGRIQDAAGGAGDDLAAFGTGFVGGVAEGAGIGWKIGKVPGALIGGAIGGLASGAAAWLNRDALTEQMANAYEVYKAGLDEENGGDPIRGGLAAMEGAAGLLGRGMSPLSNLTQGIADPNRGDGVSAMRLDDEDKPEWLKPVDIVSSVVDAGLQFGTAPARALYVAQMGGHATAKVGSLTVGTGDQFDDRSGRYRNVYSDEDANAVAAWGSALIDAGQMATAGAMMRWAGGSFNKGDSTLFDKLLLGGAAGRVEQVGARRFLLDDEGRAVASRWTGQMLVPSEAVKALAGSASARRAALATQAQSYADDLYRAATALERQEAPIKAAWVNAFAEGTEEGVQEVLDSVAMGHQVEFESLRDAFFYGSAMGLGMSVGANIERVARKHAEIEQLAARGYEAVHGKAPSKAELRDLRRNDREAYLKLAQGSFSEAELSGMRKYQATAQKLMAANTGSDVLVAGYARLAVDALQEQDLKRAGVSGQQSARLLASMMTPRSVRDAKGDIDWTHPDAYQYVSDDSVATHDVPLRDYYAQSAQSTQVFIDRLEREKSALGDDAASEQRRQEIDEAIALWRESGQWQQRITDWFDEIVLPKAEQIRQMPDGEAKLEAAKQLVVTVNAALSRAFDGYWELDGKYSTPQRSQALRQAVAVIQLRSPISSVGTYTAYRPALHFEAVLNDNRGMVFEPITSQDKRESDYDGDRSTFEVGVRYEQYAFERAATGLNLLVPQELEDGRTVISFKVSSTAHDKALGATLRYAYEGTGLPVDEDRQRDVVLRELDRFADTLMHRYNLTQKERRKFALALKAVLFGGSPAPGTEDVVSAAREVLDGTPGIDDPIAAVGLTIGNDPAVMGKLAATAEANGRNEVEQVLTLFRTHMYEARGALSTMSRATAPDFSGVVLHEAEKPRQAGSVKEIEAPSAGPLLYTLAMLTGSDSLLRISGAIKYQPAIYKDAEARSEGARDFWFEQAGQYLNMVTEQTLTMPGSAEPDTFDVQARVTLLARQIIRSASQGAPESSLDYLTWKLLTSEFRDQDGRVSTVAQMLTSHVLADINRQVPDAILQTPEKQQKLNFLRSLADDARDSDARNRTEGQRTLLREMVGGLSLADIIPEGVLSLGVLDPGGTIDQNIRILRKLSELERREFTSIVRNSPEYTESKAIAQEDRDDHRAVVHEVVDFILEAASTELSFDADGTAHGSIARANESGSESFKRIHTAAQQLLKQLRHENRTAAGLQRVFSQNPQVGRQVYEALMHELGAAGLAKNADGDPVLRSWVLDSLIEPEFEKAEMMLWRGRLASAQQHYEGQLSWKDTVHPKDTLLELILDLTNRGDLFLREEVLKKFLDPSMTRREFEKWVAASVPSKPNPVLMYEADPGAFRADQPSGGWGALGDSLRSKMSLAADAIYKLPGNLDARKKARSLTMQTAKELEDNPLDPRNVALERLIDGIGPSNPTMVPEALVSALSKLPLPSQGAHTKGVSPTQYRALAQQVVGRVMRYGFYDAANRMMNSLLGTVNVVDVMNSPELIFMAKNLRDEYGRVIELPFVFENGRPTRQSILTALQDEAISDLVNEALLTRTYTYDPASDALIPAFADATNLHEALTRPSESAFVPNQSGGYTRQADFEFGLQATVRAQQKNPQDPNPFERLVTRMVLAQLTGLQKPTVSQAEMASIVVDSWARLGRLLRMTAQLRQSVGEEQYQRLLDEVMAEQTDAAVEQINRRNNELGTRRSPSEWMPPKQREAIEELLLLALKDIRDTQTRKKLQEVVSEVEKGVTPEREAELEQELEQLAATTTALSSQTKRALKAYLSGDVYGTAVASYYIPAHEAPTASFRKTQVALYLDDRYDIADRLTGDDRAAVLHVIKDPENVTDAEWELLSRIVISHVVESAVMPGTVSGVDLTVVNDVEADAWAFDPTWRAQLSFLRDTSLPLLASAEEMVAENNTATQISTETWKNLAKSLFHPERNPMWTPAYAALAQAIDGAFGAATAGYVISAAGNNSKVQHATATASKYTWDLKIDDVSIADYAVPVTMRKTPNGMVLVDHGAPGYLSIDDLQGSFGRVTGTTSTPPEQVQTVRFVEQEIPGGYSLFNLDLLEGSLQTGEEIQLEVFVPNYRPDGWQWQNNIFFNGFPAPPSPVVQYIDNPIGALTYVEDGVNNREQRYSLDAPKKKRSAAIAVDPMINMVPDLSANPDPSEALHLMARRFVTEDLGYGRIGSVNYKAALAALKMHMLVEVTHQRPADEDGTTYPEQTELVSMDNYLSLLRQDQVQIVSARVIPMDRRTANTFYGETGSRGLNTMGTPTGNFGREGVFDPTRLSEVQQRLVKNLTKTAPLSDSMLAARNGLRRASRSINTDMRDAIDGMERFAQFMRAQAEQIPHRKKLSHDGQINLMQTRTKARQLIWRLENETLAADQAYAAAVQSAIEMTADPKLWDAPEYANEYSLSMVLLPGTQSSYDDGTLSAGNIKAFSETVGFTFGDQVGIPLSKFEEALPNDDTPGQAGEQIVDALPYLLPAGVEVKLIGGSPSLRALVEDQLDRQGYARVTGERNVWAPRDALNTLQIAAAYEGLLWRQSAVDHSARLPVFYPYPGQHESLSSLTENMGYMLNPQQRVIADTQMFKIGWSSVAHLITDNDMTRAKTLIDSLTDEQWAQLGEQTKGDKNALDVKWDAAVADIRQRSKDDKLNHWVEGGELLGSGQFTVYVVRGPELRDGDGFALYLHRQGAETLGDDEIMAAYKSGQRVIVGPSESNGTESVLSGRVLGRLPARSDSTVRLRIASTLGDINSKGMTGAPEGGLKTMWAQAPQPVLDLFSDPLLPGNDYMRGVALKAYEDADKKLNLLRAGRNFRELASFVGVNLMPLFYEGLYREAYPPPNQVTDQHLAKMQALRDLLLSVPTTTSSINEVSNRINEMAVRRMSYDISTMSFDLSDTVASNALREVLARQNHSEATIALFAALEYLSVSGTDLSDISGAPGFGTEEMMLNSRESNRMPTVFSQIVDKVPALRDWAAAQMSAKMGDGWYVDPESWDVVRQVRDVNGNVVQEIRGILEYSTMANTGETTERGFDPSADRPFSLHEMQFAESLGGITWGHTMDSKKFREMLDKSMAPIDEIDMYSVQHRATSRSEKKHPGERKPWTWRETIAEKLYRSAAQTKLGYYLQPLGLDVNYTDPKMAEDLAAVKAKITELANRLFVNSNHSEEHYIEWLVRLRLGRPAASKEGEADVIPLDKVMLSLRAIESSIGSDASKDAVFRSPLFRGVVSMVPFEVTVAMWRAYQKKGPEAYSPRLYTSKRSVNQRASTFDEFVKAFVSESLNDELAMHSPAVDQIHDAIMHQYQSRLPESMNLPVSLRAWDDILLLSKNEEYRSAIERIKEMEEAYYSGESDVMPPTLADFLEANPEMRHISVNRLTRTELRDRVTHDYSFGLTMQQIVGEGRTRELFDPEPITERERAYAESRWNKWHLDNNIPFAVRRQLAKGYAYGVDLEDSEPKESVFARPFLSIRYMLAMLNPALAVAGGVEAFWKSSLINGRKAITGESTGLVGRNLTRIVDNLAQQDNGVGVIARGLGMIPIYTDAQMERRAQVIRHSATTTALSSIIHQDLGDYGDSFNQLNRGLPQWMIKVSKFAGGMQDLARGTRGKRLTSLYIDSVVGRMRDRGYSVDQVLERLAYDPLWVQKEFPEVHKGAIQQINDLRGVQPTVISHGVDAFLHPMTSSPNALVNLSSNLLLRMPLMFSKYAANFMLTATGLRGVDTLVALGLDGRQKPNLFTRGMAVLRKGERDTTPIDMRDVVGNLDAMDAVISMGVTHSQLFLAGTILQGLGLSGEDEEEKRLRRQAEMLGAFRMLDPSDLENDFRNYGALSLDFLPAPIRQIFATTDDEGNKRAIVDLHWTMKQVLMPMFGMERFFETGDYRHVWWGFTEAIGSMPLINSMMFNRGLDMAEELTKAAHDAGVDGGPESLTDTFGFLSTATAYFQNMLMESAFLNSIYVGLDPFDRNPYIHPLRDSDGDLQRDVEGTVRGLDSQRRLSDAFDRKGVGLTSFVDDEGNVREGYLRPMGAMTRMRVLSENRLGMAILSSIFTKLSGQGSNFRYSMPVVERKFDKPERSAAEQQAIVLGVLRSNPDFLKFFTSGAEEDATLEEQALTASMMNFIEEKYSGLGEDTAYDLFQAIVDGHMPAGSEAIQGAYVSVETRLNIQERWLEELTQEAVDLGLSETVAKKLAKKAWYGPNDGSAPGIADILWDYNLIPVDRQVRYQQLNTTYQPGVDGTMWARGFKRPGVMSAFGIAPLQRAYNTSDQGSSLDSNLNVADTLLGLNTGMRGLRRTSASWDIPTDVEIADAIAKAIEDLDSKSFTPGGYGGYRRRGYSRRGGGGGRGGYAQRPNLPYGQTPRLNIPRLEAQMLQGSYHRDVRVGFTDNPLLRRDEIQRQRFSSERGRLKSWQ